MRVILQRSTTKSNVFNNAVRSCSITSKASFKCLILDEVLKKISSKLKKDDYQRVLYALKKSSSVVGDELEHLLVQAQVLLCNLRG